MATKWTAPPIRIALSAWALVSFATSVIQKIENVERGRLWRRLRLGHGFREGPALAHPSPDPPADRDQEEREEEGDPPPPGQEILVAQGRGEDREHSGGEQI